MELGDIWEEFGLSDLEQQLSGLFPGSGLTVESLLDRLLQGDLTGMIREVWEKTCSGILGNLGCLRDLFLWIMILGLLGAVVTHCCDLFPKYQVGELGFYLLYLLQSAVLVRCFSESLEIASSALDHIVLFVKLMMPTYLLAVGITTGSLTAGAGSQLMVFLIYGVEELLKGVLLPLVTGYVLLSVLTGIHARDGLSLLQGLLRKSLVWGLKGALGAVTGISFLQRLLLPALDSAAGTALEKLLGAIPGIGNSAESLLRLSASCAMVIRNSIGILLLVLLLALCLTPLLKIFAIALMLKLAAALMGVASDKRMTAAVDRAGEAGLLLFRVVGTGMLLFLVAIAISVQGLRI